MELNIVMDKILNLDNVDQYNRSTLRMTLKGFLTISADCTQYLPLTQKRFIGEVGRRNR